MCYRGDIQGTITNIQRFSLHDGGGIRTCVFLKGCPFKCPWCSNPETINPDPEYMITGDEAQDKRELIGKEVTSSDVVERLARDKVFFEESNGGITISGGECFMQPRFTLDILKGCKEKGLHTAIETTLALPVDIDAYAPYVDTWLVDFKIADSKESKDILHLDIDIRDKNLKQLSSFNSHIVARLPIIPGFTDDMQCIAYNLNNIASYGFKQVDILPFHQYGSGKYTRLGKEYQLKDVPSLTSDDVSWIAEECHKLGLLPVINGE